MLFRIAAGTLTFFAISICFYQTGKWVSAQRLEIRDLQSRVLELESVQRPRACAIGPYRPYLPAYDGEIDTQDLKNRITGP